MGGVYTERGILRFWDFRVRSGELVREEDGGFAIDLRSVVETVARLQEAGYDTL